MRLVGLDSVRFICALTVLFDHFGFFPAVRHLDRSSPVGIMLRGFINNLFCGTAAVMVFFIISGFCIHYPFRSTTKVNWLVFLARRYIRIGIPALAAMLLIHFFEPTNHAYDVFRKGGSIVWSLLAETIYYSLYPSLFLLSVRFGWNRLLLLAFAVAFASILGAPKSEYLYDFGPFYTWSVGLPCWLLGCRLAACINGSFERLKNIRGIVLWRVGVALAAFLASVLRFHFHIGYPWTMMIFGLLAYLWLEREIVRYQMRKPWRILEWGGFGAIPFMQCIWLFLV